MISVLPAAYRNSMFALSPESFVAAASVILLAVLGALFYAAFRRGWKRNGYFTIPAVILIVFGLYLAFQAFGSGITYAVVGTDIDAHPIAALTINGICEIGVMLVGTALVVRAQGQSFFSSFRLEGLRETPVSAYLLAIPIILMAQFAGEALSTLWERVWKFFPGIYAVLDKYETTSDKTVQGLVTAKGPIDFLLILLFVAVVPALAEEALFRGFAQTNIERSGHWHARPFIALFVTSILFASIHVSVFKLPGLFTLALALGWMAYRTNNLFTGALGHAVNNGSIVIALYFSSGTAANDNSDLVGTGGLSGSEALGLFLGSAIALAILAYIFAGVTSKISARGNAEREVQFHIAGPPTTFRPELNEHSNTEA